MLNKLHITTKFLLLSFISITAMTSLSVYGLYHSNATFHWVGQVYDTTSVIKEVTENIGITIHQLRELSLAMVVAPDNRSQRELHQQQIAVIEELDNTLTAWEKRLDDENAQHLLQDFIKAWTEYKKLVNVTRDQVLEGLQEAAVLNVNGAEAQQFQALSDLFSRFLQTQLEEVKNGYTTVTHNYVIARFTYIGLWVLFTLLVIFTCRLVAYSMTTPLLQLQKQLKVLAQGELIEDRVEYSGTDEIADLVQSLQKLKDGMQNTIQQANAIAAGHYYLETTELSTQGQLGCALSRMTQQLRDTTVKNSQQDWLKTGHTQLNDGLRGEQPLLQLAENILNFLTPYLEAQVSAFYLLEEGDEPLLKMIATHAYTWRKHPPKPVKLGENIVGQAALERKTLVITDPPTDYMYVQSGLGGASPRAIVVMPFLYENDLKGLIELASFKGFTPLHLELLAQVTSTIAIAVNTAQSRTKMQELLHQTQTQTEELQSQAEELQAQQEELRQTNEELIERTQELERQQAHIYEKNQEVEKSKQLIEKKAKELELASQYKSEFLANMSHELRTPLNSLLILSQILMENKPGNLDAKQIEYAKTIHSAGADLLSLINDILDLSKVEAGKMEIHAEDIQVADLLDSLASKFHPLAEQKHLAFHLTVAQEFPPVIHTDLQRLKQILNNLLSNAFKFTAQGEVRLEANVQKDSWILQVLDTGIGIPMDKQQLIFEPFQQADGSTSRRFGGTGLGLSISRQLARLLGGDIQLQSEEGKGSTFTLYLPEKLPPQATFSPPSASLISTPMTVSMPTAVPAKTSTPTLPPFSTSTATSLLELEPVGGATDAMLQLSHDKEAILAYKKVLIVDDDARNTFALATVLEDKNMEVFMAENGKEALDRLDEHAEVDIVLMDIMMPEMNGYETMQNIRAQARFRKLPIIALTAKAMKSDKAKCIEAGANDYMTKPVDTDKLISLMRVWLYR